MGNRSDHLEFDGILRGKGIIKLGEYDCDQVHQKMDYGEGNHSRLTPHHSETGIRKWVSGGHDSFWDSIFGDAWGHNYCDFVRVACGHIVLDYYWTKYALNSDKPKKGKDEIMRLAFQTFIKKEYDKKRFLRKTSAN